jgi:hypothetical protein
MRLILAQPVYFVAISKHLYCRFPAFAKKTLDFPEPHF